MAKDYYETLGIDKNAGGDQVKEAYRKLVLKYHPDVNKDGKAEAKMQEINEAYAVLSDSQKRKQYDAFGPEGFGQRYSEEDIFRGFNFDDIIREFENNMFGFQGGGMGGFGDVFGQQQEQRGVNVYLSFDDIEKGFEKEFQVQHYKRCENCRGTGGEPGSKQVKCTTCDGKGRTHIQQNTPFGRFSMVTTCSRCGGSGKIYESLCKVCKGRGQALITERFRIKAGKSEKDGKDGKQKGKFWVF